MSVPVLQCPPLQSRSLLSFISAICLVAFHFCLGFILVRSDEILLPATWSHSYRFGSSSQATKDFWDPVGNRRILWGWGVPPLDAQSLPRSVTWSPELQQLCYSPLVEQDNLRGPALPVPDEGTQLPPGEPKTLGPVILSFLGGTYIGPVFKFYFTDLSKR